MAMTSRYRTVSFFQPHQAPLQVLNIMGIISSESNGDIQGIVFICDMALEAQSVKNLPAMQETQVRFLSQEDPLEAGMATHSSILAWGPIDSDMTEC